MVLYTKPHGASFAVSSLSLCFKLRGFLPIWYHLFPFIHHHVNLFSDHLQPYIQKFVTQDRMKYTQLNIWQSNVMIKWGLYSFSTDGCCHFGKLNLSLQNLLIIAQVPIWTISIHSNAGLEIFEKAGARCENYDRKYLTTYTTTLANVH